MLDYTIRKAEYGDLKNIHLFDALSSMDGEARYEQWVWQRAIEAGQVYLAMIDQKRIAGYLMFEARGRNLHINEIFVLEKFRSEGIGHEFMRLIAHEADHRNNAVSLDVSKENKDAIKLYRHFGFSAAPTKHQTHLTMRRPPAPQPL